MQRFSQKGQADTVFEVLIAVILLGFVLVAGAFAMSSLSNTKCSKSIDLALSGLKQTIEKASTTTLISTDFLLDVPYCFGSNFVVAFGKLSDNAICSNYCPGSSGSCYLLKYMNNKDKVNPVRYLCVQISPVMSVNDSQSCNYSNSDYTIAELTSNYTIGNTNISLGLGNAVLFKNGRYKIGSTNISSNTQSPTLCIYKKVG